MATNKGQDITAYLSMDISDLKKAISEARREIASINSSFTEVAGKSSKWEKSVDNLYRKIDQLKKLIDEKTKMVDMYSAVIEQNTKKYEKNEENAERIKKVLKELKEKGVDPASKAYQDWARSLEVCESNMLDAKVEIEKTKTTLSNTKGEIVDLTRDYNNYVAEIDEARDKEERQNSALGQLEKTIEEQEEALERLKEIYKGVVLEQGKNSDTAKDLANDIEDLSGELAENKTRLNEASDAADELDQSLEETDESSEKLQSGFTVLKGVISNLVTDAIRKAIDGLKDLIATSIEFESSFADVRKVLGNVTDEEMADLEQGIRDLAQIRPQTASDIAQITATAAQLGIRGNDNLLEFTDTMVKLGDATNMTGDEAAATLAKFMNITGTAQSDVGRLGSTIVNLGNNFATTEKDISEMSMRLAGAGELAGMTEPEILAVAAALTSVGINAEAGGSAFSKLIINMSNASANGKKANEVIKSTGMSLRDLQMLSDADSSSFKELAQSLGYTSDEFQDFVDASATLEQFSQVTGMTADEFNKAFGEDALGTIQLFIGALSEMDGETALTTLNEMGIKEIRLRDAILRSTTGIENFNEAVKVANEGWEENIALDKEVNQRYQTTESRIKIVKNRFKEIGIQMKQKLQPAINGVISAFGKLADGLGWLVNIGIPKALEWLSNEGRPLTAIIIGLVSAIATFSIIVMVTQWVGALKTALIALNATMMANPIALVVAAIAALVAAFIYLWNNCEEFREFWINLWENIKSVALDVWDNFLHPVIDAIKNAFEILINSMVHLWETYLKPAFEAIGNAFKSLWNNVLKPVIGFIKDAYEALFKGIKTVWEKVLKPVFEAIGSVFKFVWETIISVVLIALAAAFTAVWYGIKALWEDVLKPVFEAVGDFFKWVWEHVLSPAIDAVKRAFTSAFNAIKYIWDNVLEPVFNKIGSTFEWVWEQVLSPTIDTIKGAFQDMADFLEKIWDGLWNDGLKPIINSILGGIESMCNGVVSGMNKVIDAMNNLHFTIPDWVPKLGGKEFGFNIPHMSSVSLPRLEKGGILKKGQVGLLEGSGSEAVVPLDQNKAWIREVAKDMKKELGIYNNTSNVNNAKSTVNNYTQIINAPKQPSRIELYRQTRNLLNFKGGV